MLDRSALFCTRLIGAIGLALALGASPAIAYDWLQFNGDQAHSGNNTAESTISAANVGTLTQLFQVTLPSVADGAPVFLESVATSTGIRSLLFITTKDGHILALDASTGATVWSHQYGANGCVDTHLPGEPCYTTSSPAIDSNRQYVYSYGLDGNVHKYQVGDGTEVTTNGWPQIATLKGTTEKGSSALAVATSGGVNYLYAVHGGYPGDNGDYQGHVTAINLATGAQKVFNTMCTSQTVHLVFAPATPNCTGQESAIWSRPGVIYDAGTGLLFFGTGNSLRGGNNLSQYWSESVLSIHPDGTGASGMPVDSYTPTNQQSLDNGDADLGSTAPAILPVPANSSVQHLAAQGGKDGLLRLLNLANLSGAGGPGHVGGEFGGIGVPQGGGVFSQPAVWVNPADGATWVFVGTSGGLSGLKVVLDANHNPSLSPQWQLNTQKASSSPLIANNVLYFAGGGSVRAYNPATGGTALWTGSTGSTHWESPIVANGVVYVLDESSKLSAFGLATSPPAFTSANHATFTIGTAGTFTVTASGSPTPTLSKTGALPSGVTFTAATGMLAGTPGAATAGSYPLTFTAANGNAPDATQSFTLTVNAASAAHTYTVNDPNCGSVTIGGTTTDMIVTCGGGGGGGTPVCTPTANPAAGTVNQPVTITANCTGQPTANSYVWTGGKCKSSSHGPTCTDTQTRAKSVTYTVKASNSAGQGSAGSVTVQWQH